MHRPVEGTQPGAYAVVLAAGAGSRFGGDKLLARLRGSPLIAHVASTIGASIQGGHLAGGVAVVPPQSTALIRALEAAGLMTIENPEAATGLASSLRIGLATLARVEPQAGSALVVLADQPLLSSSTIALLVEAWRTTRRSVRPRYALRRDAPGHPVLLDRAAWPLVREVRGDSGLGPVLRAHPEAVMTIDVAGANPEVNTPADLHSLEDIR